MIERTNDMHGQLKLGRRQFLKATAAAGLVASVPQVLVPAAKADEAAQRLKLTAQDALELGIIEKILHERDLGQPSFYGRLAQGLEKELKTLLAQEDRLETRYARFRAFGRATIDPKNEETDHADL